MSDTEETELEEIRCHACGEVVSENDVCVSDDRNYCPECVSMCERCESIVPDDETYTVVTDGNNACWCESCTNAHSSTCQYCDSITNDRNMAGSWDGDPICSTCVENRGLVWCDDCDDYHNDGCPNETSNLHDYGYKPRPVFCNHPGALDSTSHFGFELEIEPGSNDQDELIAAIVEHPFYQPERCYLKEDGSLDDGVELVTHPSDIKLFPWKQFRELLKSLRKDGYTSWQSGNCGLHVHVNRNLLGADHERKLAIGFTRLQPWISIASGREDFGYCGFAGSYSPDVWKYDRRRAINMLPKNTVEVRVMRGTLKPDSCVHSIKFAHNLVLWICKQSQSHLLATTEEQLWREFEDSLSPKTIKFLRSRKTPRVYPSHTPPIAENEDREEMEML